MGRGSLSYAEEEVKQGRMSEEQLNQVKAGLMAGELSTLVARADVYSRWSDLVALLWVDPALQKLPASYLNHGK